MLSYIFTILILPVFIALLFMVHFTKRDFLSKNKCEFIARILTYIILFVLPVLIVILSFHFCSWNEAVWVTHCTINSPLLYKLADIGFSIALLIAFSWGLLFFLYIIIALVFARIIPDMICFIIKGFLILSKELNIKNFVILSQKIIEHLTKKKGK